VRYLIPQTITSGEFSVEVEGLQTNAPNGKSKVLGMQEGTDDYITNPFRVDVQYRGTVALHRTRLPSAHSTGPLTISTSVRAAYCRAVNVGVCPQSIDDVLTGNGPGAARCGWS
jgi:hypothetical protein